jgi:hypothetical protein
MFWELPFKHRPFQKLGDRATWLADMIMQVGLALEKGDDGGGGFCCTSLADMSLQVGVA